MPDEMKEPIGFLCRWLLLASAGLSAAGAAWAGASSTFGLRNRLNMEMVCPDHVSRGGKRATGSVMVTGASSRAGRSPVMEAAPQGLLLSPVYWREQWIFVYEGELAAPGARSAAVVGMPYGPLTFRRNPVRVRVLTQEQPVIVLDSRLFMAEAGSRGQDAIAGLARSGFVVLYYPNEPGGFPEVQQELRRQLPHTPAICRPRDPAGKGLAARTPALTFRQNYVLVTGDGELAEASSRYAATYLLATGEPHARGRLRQVATLADVAASLKGEETSDH